MSENSIAQSVSVADEATILARVDEALAAYPLPKPSRVGARVDRSVGSSIDLSPEQRERLRRLPPALSLWLRTTREMQAWATHLDLVLEVSVRTFDDDGRTCRTVTARGKWLGWDVCLRSDEDSYRDVTPPAPVAMVRKAHMGILL